LAAGGLCLLLALLIPLAWIFDKATGGTLSAAEWAKARLTELRGR
jgi:hypothetical protein